MPSGPKFKAPPLWLNWGAATRISTRPLRVKTPARGFLGFLACHPRITLAWSGIACRHRGEIGRVTCWFGCEGVQEAIALILGVKRNAKESPFVVSFGTGRAERDEQMTGIEEDERSIAPCPSPCADPCPGADRSPT
jgi:hypothetical protein